MLKSCLACFAQNMSYRYGYGHATAEIRQALKHADEISAALRHSKDRHVQAQGVELHVATDRIRSALETIETSIGEVRSHQDSVRTILDRIR